MSWEWLVYGGAAVVAIAAVWGIWEYYFATEIDEDEDEL